MVHRAATVALVAGIAWLSLTSGVSGQARPATPARPYAPAKTPWGDPDIQGMWPSGGMTGVPFQRPEALGDRTELVIRNEMIHENRVIPVDGPDAAGLDMYDQLYARRMAAK